MTPVPRPRSRVVGALSSAVLLGGIHLAAPIGLLAFVALVPWWVTATPLDERRRGDAWLAYLVGFVSLSIGCHWIREVSWVGLIATVAIESCFYVLVPMGARALYRLHRFPAWLAWPLAWTAVEFLRSTVPAGGFPWLLLGHAVHLYTPLIQIADLGGASLVTLVVALVNGVIAAHWRARRSPAPRPSLRPASIVAIAVLSFTLVYGFWRPASLTLEEGARLAAIQPNIPQYIKNAEPDRYFQNNLALTAELFSEPPEEPIDLVVWSETMLHLWVEGGRPHARRAIEEVVHPYLAERDIYLLAGSSLTERLEPSDGEDELLHTNSALLFSPSGEVLGRYDKIQLVPGGEVVPLPDWLGHDLLEVFIERFVVGRNWPFLDAGSDTLPFVIERDGERWRIGTTICYENVFPWVGRVLVSDGAQLLVNISNEAWFRDSIEMDQMMGMTKFRAIEVRRSVFRATNSGISSLVDPMGRVVALLERNGRSKEVEGVLVATVPICEASTLYTGLGSAWAWALCAWVGGAILLEAWRARRRKHAAARG